MEYSIKSMDEAKAYLEHPVLGKRLREISKLTLSIKLDPVFAFTTRKLKVDGDTGKALEFSKLIKKG